MLVLRRKVGESVLIDGRTRVKVIAIEGGRIALGFDAPDDVWIQREELVEFGRPTKKEGE